MTASIKLPALALVAGLAFAGGWSLRSNHSASEIAQLRAELATNAATRSDAALKDEANTATLESTHANATIQNADALQSRKTGIAADMRAELELARRLQLSAERRAATYRAQAQADATARSHLANHTAALDRQLAAGLHVVAELAGALEQRDAEVAALCAQVTIDRRLLGQQQGLACRGAGLSVGGDGG